MGGFVHLIEDYQRLLRLRSEAVGRVEQGRAYLEALEAALSGLERLWVDLLGDPRFRLALAESPHTPTALLAWLASDSEQEVRLAVARNPSTPASTLVTLLGTWAGRLAVACNPCTPTEVLHRLAFDGDLDIRQALAANPNTPAPVLARLAHDPELGVRRRVALNPCTPPHLLGLLAQCQESPLYLALLRNPNTPGEALEAIARSDPWLEERVRRHPNLVPSRPPAQADRRAKPEVLSLSLEGRINLGRRECGKPSRAS
ncbi:MAG: hypothetical protein SFU83_02770 [Meiothermus sp.]|nr:hypothetical protein [Meiothermus sp.]